MNGYSTFPDDREVESMRFLVCLWTEPRAEPPAYIGGSVIARRVVIRVLYWVNMRYVACLTHHDRAVTSYVLHILDTASGSV